MNHHILLALVLCVAAFAGCAGTEDPAPGSSESENAPDDNDQTVPGDEGFDEDTTPSLPSPPSLASDASGPFTVALEVTKTEGSDLLNLVVTATLNWDGVSGVRMGLTLPPGTETTDSTSRTLGRPATGEPFSLSVDASLPGAADQLVRAWATGEMNGNVVNGQVVVSFARDPNGWGWIEQNEWPHHGATTLAYTFDNATQTMQLTLYVDSPLPGGTAALSVRVTEMGAEGRIAASEAMADGLAYQWQGETGAERTAIPLPIEFGGNGTVQLSVNLQPDPAIDGVPIVATLDFHVNGTDVYILEDPATTNARFRADGAEPSSGNATGTDDEPPE